MYKVILRNCDVSELQSLVALHKGPKKYCTIRIIYPATCGLGAVTAVAGEKLPKKLNPLTIPEAIKAIEQESFFGSEQRDNRAQAIRELQNLQRG